MFNNAERHGNSLVMQLEPMCVSVCVYVLCEKSGGLQLFDVKIGKIDKDGYIDIYAYIYIERERELNF